MASKTTFFSYSRTDSEFVLKLAKDLRDAGAELWLDQLDIKAGDDWDTSIEAALNSASRVIIVLSSASVKSNNVMDEVSYALESGKPVIPVMINDCTPPFRLRRLQHISFISDYQAGLTRLLDLLEHPAVTDAKIEIPVKENEEPNTDLLTAVPVKEKKQKDFIAAKNIDDPDVLVNKRDVKKYILYISIILLIVFGVWAILNVRPRNTEAYEQKLPNELIVNKWKIDQIMGPDAAKIPDEAKKQMLTTTLEYRKDSSYEIAGGRVSKIIKGTYTLSDDGKTLLSKNEDSRYPDTALVLVLSRTRMVISPKGEILNYQISLVPDNAK